MVRSPSNAQALGRAACAVAALSSVLAWTAPADAAKIACVGDSITYGYNLSDPSTQSYPAVLAMRLGASDTVQNFGVSGTTLLKSGDKPYWNETNFTASTSFEPDVVIIMLGTNDAKPQNWSNKAEFTPDYLDLIAHYRSLGALVYVATPPPVYPPGAYDIPPDVVANEVVPLVETIAGQANAPLVDVFTALSGKSDDFPDTVHPNAAGAALIAGTVQASLGIDGLGGAGATAGAGGASSGGASASGGASGGMNASGGAPTGGRANASGGVSAAGANSSGAPSAGGTSGDAGRTSSNAGAVSNGGASDGARGGSGGVSSSAGGHVSGSGAGTPDSAGIGGASPTGGAPVAPAGAPSKSPGPTSSDSSCGCRASRADASARDVAGLMLALLAFRRRRRSR